MGHHVRRLVLVLLFAAAAMATSQVETTPPIRDQMDLPPLPSPADIPVTPPCLNSISVCGLVYQDPSKLAPCCTAVKKLFGSDPECICDGIAEAQKVAKQSGLNYTVDGQEMFRRCEMPLTSCDPENPGLQNIGNAAPSARSFGALQILLVFPIFFML
ncbi:uncharacterized protein LOC123447582 [Hordeum vulgare subsp. vulgare]|uniref:Bifunctional inhibitor/plant lipid transfer protein/seed storage helical domain-containing protein n=1 Tax=Hordeum vulgare subsp. vulgare TaxID=112509 RepID=A0A8I6YLR2_HORVV|nr:uncharacterized protein LOC123447582 [Hordeum vulgare subsp. vulgare]